MMGLTIADCLEQAARLLAEAELHMIDNLPRGEALTALAAEWRMLADSLIESPLNP